MGSPPHTWRILDVDIDYWLWCRITSTYVENTLSALCWFGIGGDHLHIRGEYVEYCKCAWNNWGSPPHTWRIRIHSRSNHHLSRITSTYVENTTTHNTFKVLCKDHLHIRGEYLIMVLVTLKVLGSPPHTWRIQGTSAGTGLRQRITSTYVENTEQFLRRRALSRDHLHIRGEYCLRWAIGLMKLGSPPHTWRIQ